MIRACLESWVMSYLRFLTRHEAPEIFNQWVALAVVSATLRRRIFLDVGFKIIYPNLFVILVAPTGKRKSAAIEEGEKLIRLAQCAPLFANKATPEGLLSSLQSSMKWSEKEEGGEGKTKGKLLQGAETFIIVDEFTTFVGNKALESGLLPILTNIYDCKDHWKYVTRTQSLIYLRDIWIGMLAGTTPEMMHQSIPREIMGGGFSSRCNFVCQMSYERKQPVWSLSKEEQKLRFNLVYDLKTMTRLGGQVRMTDEVRALYEAWYLGDRTEEALDPMFGGYVERKPHQAIRLAMLFSAAESDSLIIEKHHFDAGIAALDEIEYYMPIAFQYLSSPDAGVTASVITALRKAGRPMLHSDLLRSVYHNVGSAERLRHIISDLDAMGKIKITNRGGLWYEYIETDKEKRAEIEAKQKGRKRGKRGKGMKKD